MSNDCQLCSEISKVAVRGTIQDEYVGFCPFHAGAMQMIFEKLHVSDSVKWRPLFEDDKD